MVKRPELRRCDRVVLAVASRLLPRERWTVFVVSPQTLLRWQRELVRRKWTYRRRPAGRPPLEIERREFGVAAGARESALGLRPDPGRAAQARRLGRCDPRSARSFGSMGLGPAPRRTGPSLGGVLARAGARRAGLRLLHRRDCRAADSVCAVLDRARLAGRPP